MKFQINTIFAFLLVSIMVLAVEGRERIVDADLRWRDATFADILHSLRARRHHFLFGRCCLISDFQSKDPRSIPSRKCHTDTDCADKRYCKDNSCQDPCINGVGPLCGVDAICFVRNHRADCKCPESYLGDPYIRCFPQECTVNGDCLSFLACVESECIDPCVGVCGTGADCAVKNHSPTCTCPSGYNGNPFISCIPVCHTDTDCADKRYCNDTSCQDPCLIKGVCGVDAICLARNHSAVCSCPDAYQGNPYVECLPECTTNGDCASYLACVKLECIDPCGGVCGKGAECDVVRHRPICSCPSGYTGDPFTNCIPVTTTQSSQRD